MQPELHPPPVCQSFVGGGPAVFVVGDRVRCHADCSWHPWRVECSDGRLLLSRGSGWWMMDRSTGATLVHEQELERLSPGR